MQKIIAVKNPAFRFGIEGDFQTVSINLIINNQQKDRATQILLLCTKMLDELEIAKKQDIGGK